MLCTVRAKGAAALPRTPSNYCGVPFALLQKLGGIGLASTRN
jgi:hypothetical protein